MHVGGGDERRCPLQIALEPRPIPDYDVSRVVVVLNDPAAVGLLGFFVVPGETLPPSGTLGATERGVASSRPWLRLLGELWYAAPGRRSYACCHARRVLDVGLGRTSNMAT